MHPALHRDPAVAGLPWTNQTFDEIPLAGNLIPEYLVTRAKPGKKLSREKTVEEQPASKSQLKRDVQALKSLTTDLLRLNASQLESIPLDNDVVLAIEEAQKFRSHGARRRQLQYVSKLIRRNDATSILEAVAAFQAGTKGLTAGHHRSEKWRESLLLDGDRALTELLRQHPAADAQSIRQLVRNAQLEKNAGKPPASARKLFRVLRAMDTEQDLPPVP